MTESFVNCLFKAVFNFYPIYNGYLNSIRHHTKKVHSGIINLLEERIVYSPDKDSVCSKRGTTEPTFEKIEVKFMITPGRNLYILHLCAISKTTYVTMTALIFGIDMYFLRHHIIIDPPCN
jgi:hypothetical protein